MEKLFNSWQWQLKNSSTIFLHGVPLSSEQISVASKYQFLSTPYSEEYFTSTDALKNIYYPKLEERELSYVHPSKDIMGDRKNEVMKGVIHKYSGRLLLLVSLECPLYCRYCTRKNSESDIFDISMLLDLYNYTIENSIDEIILSGGDPLMLSNTELECYLREISSWCHISTIRIHTKLISTLPMRFYDDDLLSLFDKYSDKLWLVSHFVTSDEFNSYSIKAIKNIQKCGIVILNQNPVLKGVNDSVESLSILFKTLIKYKIKPYYLFQIDQVDGTAHFNVDLNDVLSFFEELQKNLSGIALPKIIVDLPGGAGKVPVGVNYLRGEDDDCFAFSSPSGEIVKYSKR